MANFAKVTALKIDKIAQATGTELVANLKKTTLKAWNDGGTLKAELEIQAFDGDKKTIVQCDETYAAVLTAATTANGQEGIFHLECENLSKSTTPAGTELEAIPFERISHAIDDPSDSGNSSIVMVENSRDGGVLQKFTYDGDLDDIITDANG